MADSAAKEQSPIGSLEAPVMGMISAIPVNQFKTWGKAYFRPTDIYNENKSAGLGVSAVHFALIGLLSWIGAILMSILSVVGIPGAMMLLPGIIIYPIIFVIFGFIGSILYFVLAKILGGKGSFSEQTIALAVVLGGTMIISWPFNVLSGVPLLGFVFGLVALAISIYGIYNQYKVLKAAHQLSTIRAAILILVPIVIAIVVAVVLAAALVALLAGAGLAAAGSQMPTSY